MKFMIGIILAIFGMTILSACGAGEAQYIIVANEDGAAQISPYSMTATALCIISTDEARRVLFGYQVYGTPTPDPLITPTPTAMYVVDTIGDPANGETLFHGAGECALCHSVADEETIIGPSLQTIASRAGYMRPPLSAEDYLTGAILYPNAYIPTRGKAGIMPVTYQQQFTAQEIADLVAYLMTLD